LSILGYNSKLILLKKPIYILNFNATWGHKNIFFN
jgi:hypothetical protein